MNIFNAWWLYVILFLIINTTYNQFYKTATKTIIRTGALTVIIELFGGLCILILSPLYEYKFPSDIRVYILLGIAVIFYAISDRLNTAVRKGVEASIFSILKQLNTVFMIIAGLLFLREPFILTKIIGASLIIFSNALILYEKGKFHFNKYIFLSIISSIASSVAVFVAVNISEEFNLPIYISSTLVLPAILIIIFDRIKYSDLKKELLGNNPLIKATAGILGGLMCLVMIRAYELGPVTTIAPLLALSVASNILASYLFQGEKKGLIKKLIAAILIIVSIILIKM